jgi:ribonuclease Z
VTILGDTRRTDNAVRLAVGADMLVHEATYEAAEEKMARKHGHSTSKQAAEVAKEAGAKRLILTHISARYVGPLISHLAKEARAVHENSFVAKDFYEEKI